MPGHGIGNAEMAETKRWRSTTPPCLARSRAIPALPDHVVTMWDAHLLGGLKLRGREEVKEVVNQMGLLSAQAQQLKCPVTSFDRMRIFRSHRLYVLLCTAPSIDDGDGQPPLLMQVKGMLKVGAKDLFIRRQDGTLHEVSPLCVLDFYVHHSCQRSGLGRFLFEHMLVEEGFLAHEVGYDRPSPKLLSFLEKYHGLAKYVPQANQFVLFDAYFEKAPSTPRITVSQSLSTSKRTSRTSSSSLTNVITRKMKQLTGDQWK